MRLHAGGGPDEKLNISYGMPGEVWGIRSIPEMLLFKAGQRVGRGDRGGSAAEEPGGCQHCPAHGVTRKSTE